VFSWFSCQLEVPSQYLQAGELAQATVVTIRVCEFHIDKGFCDKAILCHKKRTLEVVQVGMKESVGCGRPLHVWKRGDLSGELLREGRQDGLVAHGCNQ